MLWGMATIVAQDFWNAVYVWFSSVSLPERNCSISSLYHPASERFRNWAYVGVSSEGMLPSERKWLELIQ